MMLKQKGAVFLCNSYELTIYISTVQRYLLYQMEAVGWLYSLGVYTCPRPPAWRI